MESNRNIASSLTSTKPETEAPSIVTTDTATDVLSLEDNEFEALLQVASNAPYATAVRSELCRSVPPPVSNPQISNVEGSLLSRFCPVLSNKAQTILSTLQQEADQEKLRKDEAADKLYNIRGKLGKSASHESCQPSQPRCVYEQNSNIEVDTPVKLPLNSAVYVSKADDVPLTDNNTRITRHFAGRSSTLPLSNSFTRFADNNCRLSQPHSFNSATDIGQRSNAYADCSNTNMLYMDEDAETPSKQTIEYYKQHNGDRFMYDVTRFSQPSSINSRCSSNSTDDNVGNQGKNNECAKSASTLEESTGIVSADIDDQSSHDNCEPESTEMRVFGGGVPCPEFFQSSVRPGNDNNSVTEGQKRRSSSQRGDDNRREYQSISMKGGTAERGHVTKSELGPLFTGGSANNRLTSRLGKPTRRKKTTDDKVIKAEQMNGFRGSEPLENLLMYIEGSEAKKKLQDEQQVKKSKKKMTTADAGSNTTNKKEKIRRSTEGDDDPAASSARSATASEKRKSAESLHHPRNVARSVSDDDSIIRRGGSVEPKSIDADEDALGVAVCCSDNAAETSDDILAERIQMEELQMALKDDAEPTVPDDHQFIPVINKKQKKNKADGRGSRGAGKNVFGNSDIRDAGKRSATPPPRERDPAKLPLRKRRNSLDYTPVGDDQLSTSIATNGSENTLGDSSMKDSSASTCSSSGGRQCAAALDVGTVMLDDSGMMLQTEETKFSEEDESRPSYANVAAAGRQFHSPTLGDFLNQPAKVKTKARHGGGADRSNGESYRQPRQATSLNASRSSSPVNILTASSTNLANASTPDLKSVSDSSAVVSPRGTYATVVAEKRSKVQQRVSPVAEPNKAAANESPVNVSEVATEWPIVSSPEENLEKRHATTNEAPSAEMAVKSVTNSGTDLVSDRLIHLDGCVQLTDTGDMVACTVDMTSLIKTTIDMSSPPDSSKSDESGNGSHSLVKDRRNSCPVQFLDKLLVKPSQILDLYFFYDGEALNEPSTRINDIANDCKVETVSSRVPSASVQLAFGPKNNQTGLSQDVGTKLHPCRPAACNNVPDNVLRNMVDYVSKAWADFTHDAGSAVYYKQQ